MKRTWLITGVSSGLGKAMTEQLLDKGDTVIGTVRNPGKVQELLRKYPLTFDCQILDVTDMTAVKSVVDIAFSTHGRIDVIVSNAGYSLFGAAEELSDSEVAQITAVNLSGPIQLIRASLPHLRGQHGGKIIQISSCGGQVAYPGASMYHATKFGIEGFCESVAQEAAPFGISMTIAEPGGARTEFRESSAKIADLMKEYDGSPAHSFLRQPDHENGSASADPQKIAQRIIESVDNKETPLRIVFGSQALKAAVECLEARLADYRKQTETAASTDASG